MKQNKLITTHRSALRQTLSPPAHSVRTPKKKTINLRHSARNSHSNTTNSYFSATVSTTDGQETARGYVTLRRDVAYNVPRRSKRQHRASVPTRLESVAAGEAIQKGLYSIARRGRRMKGRLKERRGRACCGSVYLNWYTVCLWSLFNDSVRN